VIRLFRCQRDDLPDLKPFTWNIESKTCDHCDAVMVNPRPGKRFCSERCGSAARKPAYVPRTYAVECGDCGVEFVARDSRKRYCSEDCWPSGKKVNISPRRRRRIYQRDRWCCQLCGEKVDRRAKYTDRAPSIDHIIPRSLHGTDEDENLQLAHRGCNSEKGNRAVGEQLLLVG
jgi:hypothetical protein